MIRWAWAWACVCANNGIALAFYNYDHIQITNDTGSDYSCHCAHIGSNLNNNLSYWIHVFKVNTFVFLSILVFMMVLSHRVRRVESSLVTWLAVWFIWFHACDTIHRKAPVIFIMTSPHRLSLMLLLLLLCMSPTRFHFHHNHWNDLFGFLACYIIIFVYIYCDFITSLCDMENDLWRRTKSDI